VVVIGMTALLAWYVITSQPEKTDLLSAKPGDEERTAIFLKERLGAGDAIMVTTTDSTIVEISDDEPVRSDLSEVSYRLHFNVNDELESIQEEQE